MAKIQFNSETDSYESGASSQPLEDRVFVEVKHAGFRAGVFKSGDLYLSGFARVLDADQNAISGATLDHLLVLPYKNPLREDHVVSNDEKKKRYKQLYAFFRGLDMLGGENKYIWDNTAKQFVDENGDEVDSKEAREFNTGLERKAAEIAATMWNDISGDQSDELCSDGGSTQLQAVSELEERVFITRIVALDNGRARMYNVYPELPEGEGIAMSAEEVFASDAAA